MRNENKIVELLSESLKRQDQMVEQMSGMNTRLSKHESVLGRIVKSLDNLTDVVIQSDERLARQALKESLMILRILGIELNA